MSFVLAKGVQLHVIPTKKYKTIHLLIRFSTRLDVHKITRRTLLASLLETNSLHFPNQTVMNQKLAEMYGASFGLNVSRKGNVDWLNLSMTIVNDRYLQTTGVLAQAVAFVKEILFSPNVKDGAFDAETFQREKENLRAYFQSVKEDKQMYASLALQELYFSQSKEQRIPSFGTVALLEEETAASLAAYYQEMLAEDQVDILVLGDVEESEVQRLFQMLPFQDRAQGTADLFYTQPVHNVIEERVEQQQLAQSKLNLGYQTDIYFGDPNYFALQIFNGLFGGFPHSKLFVNVREKAQLAYYASSNIDTFRGFMSVQTGIDRRHRNQVMHLIATELENIRQGQLTDLEFSQTKAMLINQYLLSLDNANALIGNQYMYTLLPHTKLTAEEWVARVQAVTKEDIQKVAQMIQLQAVFFLEGDATTHA